MHEFRNSIHSALSSTVGGAVTIVSPLEDWLSRLALGTMTGILVWLFTKLASHVHTKFSGKP